MSPTLTFTPAMFHAARKGLKDTTRRVITKACFRSADGRVKFLGEGTFAAPHLPGEIKPMVTSWAVDAMFDSEKPSYCRSANGNTLRIWFDDGSEKPSWAGKSRPGRFLPKALYPLAPQVEILTVTPEFLHDLTEESAIREGIQAIGGKFGVPNVEGDFEHQTVTARAAYFKLWDSINAERDNGQYAAANNPACWTITFRPL